MDGSENTEVEFESPTNVTQEKWGALIDGGGNRGFTIVPDVLMRNQGKLGITTAEMVVLMNLIAHWWFSEKRPFPGNNVLGERTGLSRRSVQRAMSGLKSKGLIEIAVTRKSLSTGGYLSRREVDFKPLKRRLFKLKELEQQEEQ